ncbi:hypothetical protein NDU88_004297 [Pleurodeles waltl]|uniref:Uncharacterized protein n=1 Tax=Pleurodeles waltl TaxID=8319 RepID=A0AAV7UEN8_PLEWA|nr:hypothetical protein NDU88_004297 [Pleurodeles waltl]
MKLRLQAAGLRHGFIGHHERSGLRTEPDMRSGKARKDLVISQKRKKCRHGDAVRSATAQLLPGLSEGFHPSSFSPNVAATPPIVLHDDERFSTAILNPQVPVVNLSQPSSLKPRESPLLAYFNNKKLPQRDTNPNVGSNPLLTSGAMETLPNASRSMETHELVHRSGLPVIFVDHSGSSYLTETGVPPIKRLVPEDNLSSLMSQVVD